MKHTITTNIANDSEMRKTNRTLLRPVRYLLLVICSIHTGCVYYNTFYNAKSYYKEGVKLKAAGSSGMKEKFEKSIAKSAIVVKRHINSRWADDALFLIGVSYYQLGEYHKAIQNLDDLLAIFPNTRFTEDARYYKALSLAALKDYGQAYEIFQDLAEHSKRYRTAVNFQIAKSFFDKEDFLTGIDSLTEFLKKHPSAQEKKSAQQLLAESYFKIGDYKKASESYNTIVRATKNPKERTEVQIRLAEALFENGNYEEVLSVLDRILGLYPEFDNRIYLLKGKTYLKKSARERAFTNLRQVKSGTEASQAYYLMGLTYETEKNFRQAKAYFDTAQIKSPGSEFAIRAQKHNALLKYFLEKTTPQKFDEFGKKPVFAETIPTRTQIHPDSLSPAFSETLRVDKPDSLSATDSIVQDSAMIQFLIAEILCLNLECVEDARDLYCLVADSWPNNPLAPKALYAQAWILEHLLLDKEGANEVHHKIIERYPKTEYAKAAREKLGIIATPAETLLASGPTTTETQNSKVKSQNYVVYFEFDSAEILDEYYPVLEAVKKELKDNPTMKLHIEGHCDSIGTLEYNYHLGLRRATANRNFLIKRGVDSSRISIKSYGETQPVSENELAKNRRCEFSFSE